MKNYLNNNFDFDALADVFDELPLWSAPFGLKLLDYVQIMPKSTALDIGFGTGFPLTELAMRLGPSSVVFGIDLWKAAIEKARKKINYYGINNIRLIEGDAATISLDNDSIDIITSNNGINNVENIDTVLAECHRVLRHGGQLLQTMNTGLSMFEFYRELENVLQEKNLPDAVEKMHRHIAQKRPPVETMLDMLQSRGFKIRHLVHDQFHYTFADGTAMFNHYFIRMAFMDAWVKLLPPDQVADIFDVVEIRLNKQAAVLGGMKLTIPFVLIDAVK